jgi:hypothetical protein
MDIQQMDLVNLEKLRPYYEGLIADANGDMDLAIQRLTEDYDTGVRYANENWSVIQNQIQQDSFIADRVRRENLLSNTGRTLEDMYNEKRIAEEDAAVQNKEVARLAPQERASMLEAQNKRGTLESTIKTSAQTDLEARQQARQEAINTALARKEQVSSLNAARGTSDLNTNYQRQVEQAELDKVRGLQSADMNKARAIESATTPYQRGLQDWAIKFPRYLDALNQEMVGKASDMTQIEYQNQYQRDQLLKDQFMTSYNS